MRLLGIPVALFVIVAVPTLIAQEDEVEEPAVAEAKLTIRLNGDEGAKDQPVHVRVLAVGEQPTTSVRLVDATGTKTGTVTGDEASACEDAMTLDSGAGTDVWCLRLSDVSNGAELSGVAGGPGTELTLTVTRRDSFIPWPLIVLLLGFATAVIVALAPKGLRRFVRRVALARLLERNRSASASKKIAGLDAWVSDRLVEGADPSAVFSTIASVIQQGPDRARAARKRLADALKGDPLGAGHPFAAAARAEAERSDHLAADFLDALGKPRAQLPASKWLDALTKMKENRAELDAAEQTITTKISPGCRRGPTRALNVARAGFGRIAETGAVTDLDALLDTLTKAIDETLADPDCRLDSAGLTDEDVARTSWHDRDFAGEQIRGVPEVTESLDLEPTGSDWWVLTAVVLTILACLAVLGFAAVTVEESAHRGKHTFGSFNDYFTLFSASVASGAAASVLGLLAYWRPDPPAATS